MADESDDERDFNWLRRTSRGDSYVSYSAFSDFSACSFEFGHCGYAACCTYGGQLLQFSAPSRRRVNFVKGAFSNSLYASLARAQRDNGGQCTFGIEVETDLTPGELSKPCTCRKPSQFRLGKMLERGCFNYRWPLHEYPLVHKEKQTGDSNRPMKEEKEIGTCVMFSFIKGGTLYQVMRLDQRHGPEHAPEGEIRLTLGGIVQFNHYNLNTSAARDEEETNFEIGKFPSKCLQVIDKNRKIIFQARLYQYVSDEGRSSYADIELRKSEVKSYMGTAHESDRNKWAACHAHRPLFSRVGQGGRQERHRAAVFVAAFRIIEGTELPSEFWNPEMPCSSAIRHYVGANPDNERSATGFMWDTISLEHCLPQNSLSQIAEIRLLGRTLEKIVHVDMMPAEFPKVQRKKSAQVMLISNLFLEPDADYKSLFWKVRFLIKVYAFLGTYANEDVSNEKYPDPPEEAREEDTHDSTLPKDGTASAAMRVRRIAKYQRHCIRTRLEGVIRFLIQQLSNRESSLFKKDTEDSKDRDGSSIYYVMMTLWYVVRHQRSFTWVKSLLGGVATNIHYLSEICPDHETFGIGNKEKIPFLQWYHYGSIQKLYEAAPPIHGLEHKVIQLERATLKVSAGKLSSKRPYSANDEIVDRLSFLAHELELETIDDHRRSVASLAARRVRARDFTRHLNPGRLGFDEEGFTDGPWEVHALCHHSRLVVSCQERYDTEDWGAMDQRAEEMDLYKGKICQFLNSEATLTACWERSHLKARKGLIHSEASSVFGSTLLDIYLRGLWEEPHNDSLAVVVDGPKRVVQELLSMKTLMAQQLKTLELLMPEAGLAPPIEWAETWRPPRLYHPDNFVESLDDTSDLYQRAHLKNASYDPSLEGYVSRPGVKDFTKDNLQELAKLGCVQVADIVETKKDLVIIVVWKDSNPVHPRVDSEKSTENLLVERLHDSLVDLDVRHRFLVVTSPKLRIKKELLDKRKKLLEENSELLCIYKELQDNKNKLLDNEEGPQYTTELLDTLVYVLCPHSAPCLSNHLLKLSKFSLQNGSDWVAYITLVSWEIEEADYDVPMNDKTLSRLRREYLRQKKDIHAASQKRSAASVFNWTPVRFFLGLDINKDVEKGMESSLTSKDSASPSTSDRVSHNAHSSERPGEGDQEFRNRMELTPILVPEYLKSTIKRMQSDEEKSQFDEQKKKKKHRQDEQKKKKKHRQDELMKNIFKPQVSSFVLATNGFGDFSKCTIISELLTREGLMVEIAKKARKLRQFVHQPQTGRCLVFLQVLTVIIRNMIGQYKKALTSLLSVLDLDVCLMREAQVWYENHDDVIRFQQLGRWSLEALHKLHYPLKLSIESIEDAREQLTTQIKEGPGTRSEQLEKICQGYLDSFGSCFAELTAVAGDLEHIIELNSRYKDAFEAILTLGDSRASLHQNLTIERLTYPTIIYLPIGLMAAIFAIPETHNVVFRPMGRGWFIGSILIMLLFTISVAFYIPKLMRRLR